LHFYTEIPFGDGERSPPLADPRFVSNRCNPIQSYTYSTTTYPCTYTSYITSVYTLTTTTTTTVTIALALRVAETPTSDNHSDDYDAIDATTDYISDISPTTPVPEFA
jgi:transglutaminase-like putative cysteine protease